MQPKIDEVAEKFTFSELQEVAKKLDEQDFYVRVIKSKPGEMDKAVFFRALVEAKITKAKLDSFNEHMRVNGVTPENTKIWMDMLGRLQLLMTKSGGEVRTAFQKLGYTKKLVGE